MSARADKPRLVLYQPEHARALSPRGPDARLLAARADVPAFLDRAGELGPAFSLLAGEEVLACGGVVAARPGRGEAWCLASETIRRWPLALHRAARRMLAAMARAERLERIVCTRLAGDTGAAKWLRSLGFKPTGGTTRLSGLVLHHYHWRNTCRQRH
ncbi:hypothetical protein [Desulfohalovibrio reitneri]|uniref:hypothetical protein n=1 Tax=Desulfohalovibrio reitneri TaxID=1307759 RepID=UPI0004A6D3CB|nr:hypothetical protein [Desulfohalovibrio reitneri]